MNPPPHELLELARQAAESAARLLMGGYRSRPSASEKGPRDLVTEFDVASEALLRRQLDAADIGFVAEEGGGERGGGRAWYVDPLDGTTNYVHGHPCWAVSVGLLDASGQPELGVVYAPALAIEWYGGREVGAFRNDEPCAVSATSELATALVATGFPPDRTRSPDNNLDAFVRVIQRVRGVRRCGSASIDCCFVADGTYDGYWERRLHPWDYAGGCAVALGAGAMLSDLRGRPADLTRGEVLLTNGRLHDSLGAAVGARRDAP